MSELANPPEGDSVELLRAWIVGESLQCALQVDAFPDPGAWGEVLADLVHHIADALHQQEGADTEQTVRRILEVFHEEMRSSGGE
jgi:hypothetical protein